ncbi:hypothetical protein [Bacillus licheniformis]|uniref:hypothetical protein n=1 Tax=Bacillus licheniformis TaxID=1402 RepID=UPI00138865D8|nr:hypothetical protein [Bacillus licheniformis]TWM63643.1 hypothetical protein CHCC14810_4278 [Bacillus licheniformis]
MNHFLQTKRIGFSLWKKENLNLAKTLWGNRDVTNYLTADGIMDRRRNKKPFAAGNRTI